MATRYKMQVLNCFKNKKTGEVKKIWQTKEQYENLSFEFESKWKQVGCKK